MNIEDVDIKTLIPQREPIIMVSKLIYANKTCATTILNINDDNIFVDKDEFNESGMIENIAQTAAALNGYNTLSSNGSVKLGYIGAIKNLSIFKLAKVNSIIETSVVLENQIMNVDILKGTIKQDNSVICECEMRVFLQDELS